MNGTLKISEEKQKIFYYYDYFKYKIPFHYYAVFIKFFLFLPSWTVREIVHFYIFSESLASYH